MVKIVGAYFWQCLWQGIILGAVALVALIVPWWPLKAFVAIVMLFLLWRLPKNPRTHWKRMFTLVMGVALIGSGISAALELGLHIGQSSSLQLVAQLGSAPGWFLFGIAALIVVADVAQEFPRIRARARDGVLWLSAVQERTPSVSKVDGQYKFFGNGEFNLGLINGPTSLTITAVKLRFKSLIFFWWPRPDSITVDFRREGEIQWGRGTSNAPILRPNTKISVLVRFEGAGKWSGWRIRRWLWSLQWPPRCGELVVTIADDPPREATAYVRFRLMQT